MKKMKQFKQGAASFYVVIFATLILMVIVASFASVITSEIARTSNDDLSQSAYDSAMAGVEDAKLAYYNYRNCLTQGAEKTGPKSELDSSSDVSCGAIIWYMEATESEYSEKGLNRCDMVKYILGRDTGEIVESNTSNNMQQEYTCVEVSDSLGDYRSTVSSSDTVKIVKAKFDNNVAANDIKSVKVSWYMNNDSDLKYSNFDGNNVTFPNASDNNVSIPPTISLGLVQTAQNFDFADFDLTQGEYTDRGMIYLVPTNNKEAASKSEEGNYLGAYNGTNNYVNKDGLYKSNDKIAQNLPYVVYCNEEVDEEFLCSTVVEIPEPVGGNRNNNTFVFAVGLPYGKPATDFSLEFYCGDEKESCAKENVEDEGVVMDKSKADLKGVQVDIDSTGRANDLYRRVEVRLESSSDYSLSVFGPVELFSDSDDGNDVALKKVIEKVTSEYNF